MLAITTDYLTDHGNPEPYLRRIADAGFSALHWCHHWNTDFIYREPEIAQIDRWLLEYGLQITDVHGSDGQEKRWYATEEYARMAGVDLVSNRLEFAARLGAEVVIMHVMPPAEPDHFQPFWDAFRRSLDSLEPLVRLYGVPIALENLYDVLPDGAVRHNHDVLEQVFASYAPDFVGLCYDTGHANIGGNHIDRIDALKGRLLALHLHDNDGQADQHKPLFTDSIDWPRVAALIRTAPFRRTILLETLQRNSGFDDELAFLRDARLRGQRFAALLDAPAPA